MFLLVPLAVESIEWNIPILLFHCKASRHNQTTIPVIALLISVTYWILTRLERILLKEVSKYLIEQFVQCGWLERTKKPLEGHRIRRQVVDWIMSDDFLESLAKLRVKPVGDDQSNNRKQGGFLCAYSFGSSSQSASPETSSFDVVERVPRLLFSLQNKEPSFRITNVWLIVDFLSIVLGAHEA